MKEFKPPISERDIEDLIAIGNSTTSEWQQSAIDQAKEELQKRGVTKDFQQKILEKWKEEERQINISYQKQLKENELEGYTIGEMIYILYFSPLILIGKWNYDLSLSNLKRENYKKKFKQRFLLLLSGLFSWILFLTFAANLSEKERQKEIDSVDISDWEKVYYGSDSSTTKTRSDTFLTK